MNEQNRESDPFAEADAMEQLLSMAMPQRPEPAPFGGLAERAIQRARMAQRSVASQQRGLAIARWRIRAVTTAAVLLIGIFLVMWTPRVSKALTDFTSGLSSATSQSDTASATAASTDNSTSSLALLGGGLLIVALAGLAAVVSVTGNRSGADSALSFSLM